MPPLKLSVPRADSGHIRPGKGEHPESTRLAQSYASPSIPHPACSARSGTHGAEATSADTRRRAEERFFTTRRRFSMLSASESPQAQNEIMSS